MCHGAHVRRQLSGITCVLPLAVLGLEPRSLGLHGNPLSNLGSLVNQFIFIIDGRCVVCLCTYVWIHMLWLIGWGPRTTWWNWFFPSTFAWDLGLKFGWLSGLSASVFTHSHFWNRVSRCSPVCNSLCRSGHPWTDDSFLASAFQVLGLQTCATMLSLENFCFRFKLLGWRATELLPTREELMRSN